MEWTNVSFDYVLDDLSARFILNLPEEELRSVERIFFQIEQAHWFYEDFIRERNPALPSFSLKKFSAKFFQHCPLLHEWSNEHETAFANFMEYKIRVPVCGAIILNESMDKCILVKGWVAKSCWGFPKGKINQDEPDTLCAIREVWEETGFDISSRITDEDYVELTKNDQRIRLYIVKGVPEDTVFETQTRKEISKIEWHRLVDLPATKPKPVDRGHYSGKESGSDRASNANAIKNFNRYYMVTPFVQKLKSWIAMQRKIAKRKTSNIPIAPMVDRSSLPVISSSTASRDSHLLKSMLGIGAAPSPSTPQPHDYLGTPPTGSHPSSESLKVILGIQNINGTPATRSFSPSLRAASTSTPESSTTGNGSETLKALLGISSSADNTPLPQAFGTSPALAHGLANHRTATHHWQDSSPSLLPPSPMLNRHSMPAKPQEHTGPGSGAFGRKSSVDLLTLLNGGTSLGSLNGGGGGGSPLITHFIQPSNGFGGGHLSNNGNNRPLSYGGHGKLGGSAFTNGYSGARSGDNSPRVDPRRAKTNSMQNFTFDLDALV
ncbi:mRNA-decapping enzyme subunit 2 [Podila horticola]|nr:mRNA-decapping enzyme subunit 2 [Podila horticola]